MNAYCWATECNLATLELLKKSNISSKEQIERQTSICNKMVSLVETRRSTDKKIIEFIVVNGTYELTVGYPRLAEILGIQYD